MPILVSLGLSVFELGPMYMTDRPIMSEGHSYMSLPIRGGRIIIRPQDQSTSVAEWLKYLPGQRQDSGPGFKSWFSHPSRVVSRVGRINFMDTHGMIAYLC